MQDILDILTLHTQAQDHPCRDLSDATGLLARLVTEHWMDGLQAGDVSNQILGGGGNASATTWPCFCDCIGIGMNALRLHLCFIKQLPENQAAIHAEIQHAKSLQRGIVHIRLA